MNKTRQLALLTVVAVVAVLAGGYALLVKPKSGEIADVRAETETQLSANRTLQTEIQRLKAQAKNLPKTQARLAEIGRRLPSSPALPSLIRSLTDASDKAGVELISLAPSTPQLTIGAPGAPAAPAAGGTTAAAAPAGTDALAYIPIKVKVRGSYFHLEDFLSNVESLPRSYLVSEFMVQESDAEDALPNELDIELSGRVFMVVPRPAPAAPATAAAPAS